MKKEKNIILCVFLSALSGIFAGALVFFFKFAASYVIHASVSVYEFARENIIFIPLLLIGAVLISLAIYYILKIEPSCRGGGIPTAIAYIRGNLSFNWIKTVLFLPLSALLTFLSGIPLGNEGPSVQLGCATGKAAASVLKNKNQKVEKYIMTATASAGFAAATGAPLSAVVFAFEEIYRSFSWLLLTASAVAIACAASVNILLGKLLHTGAALFSFSINYRMPLKYIWASVLVGIVTGVAVMLIAFFDRITEKLLKRIENVSMFPKILAVSLITVFFGLYSTMFTGSGHAVVEKIFENGNIGISLLLATLIVRTLLLITAGGVGITGGKFLPTLALGALLGELSARVFISAGFISDEYRALLVLMGIAAFLGAKSKIPVVALCFCVEALCGWTNIFHFIVCILCSYFIVTVFKVKDFSETDIEKNKEIKKETTEKIYKSEVKL